MAEKLGFDINKFIKGGNKENKHVINLSDDSIEESNTTKKRGRKKKEDSENTNIIQVNNTIVPQSSMSYIQENIPYANAYTDTNKQLDDSIAQLNALGGELFTELQAIKASKTLKNKYGYINDMTATATSIITAKISAIKEKNKSINDANHLELARIKELKTTTSQEDDNIRISNMYDAFINTPIGVGRGVLGPSMQDVVIPNNELTHYNIGDNDQAIWEQSLDPAQNRMILEAKGTIETVVVYDEASGNRWFDVIDKTTGNPVPNVEKPDSTYIYDLDINIRGGFAKDSNRNTVYPLIVVNNGDTSINNY